MKGTSGTSNSERRIGHIHRKLSSMKSLLEQVIEIFDARVLAAGNHISSHQPCRGVHLTELPDPTPWLKGGELIVTTGLGVGGSEELQRGFVQRIAARGCIGLGYSAVDLGDPPPAMVETAEQVGLPLFQLPNDLPLIEVTMYVAQEVLSAQYAALRSAVSLHSRVLSAVSQNSGLPAILAAASQELQEYGLAVLDFFGEPIAQADPHGCLSDVSRDDLQSTTALAARHGGRFDQEIENHFISASAIHVGGELEAFLVVAGPRAPREPEDIVVQQLIAGVTMGLAREMSVRKTRRAAVEELLESLAANHLREEVLAERMRKVGVDARRPFRMVCVVPGTDQDPVTVCRAIEDDLTAISPSVGYFDGAIYVAAHADRDEITDAINSTLRRRGWHFPIGRGRQHSGPAGLLTAFRECKAVIPHPYAKDGIYDVEDLDVVSLLASSQGELAGLVVSRVIGPLIEYDAAEQAQLLSTLECFIRHGCRPGPTSAALFVHRHTLAYRLERIAQITGRDPRDGNHLLELGLAIELYQRLGPPSALAGSLTLSWADQSVAGAVTRGGSAPGRA